MTVKWNFSLKRVVGYGLAIVAWVYAGGGCSTTELVPPAPPAPNPPAYVKVPHPLGLNIVDIEAIFRDPSAPSLASLDNCDADFNKLLSLTQDPSDIERGARELVRQNPVKYHWCFYGKLLGLETFLKATSFIDQRQKKTLDTYAFLAPIARAFLTEYNDSRYLRWAIYHYRRISEWVFYRRLELSPAGTSELVDVSNPFGLWRQPATSDESILAKYGIHPDPGDAAKVPAPAAPAAPRSPASASTAPVVPDFEKVQPPQSVFSSDEDTDADAPPAAEAPLIPTAPVAPANPSTRSKP